MITINHVTFQEKKGWTNSRNIADVRTRHTHTHTHGTYLQPSVERALYRDALGRVRPVGGDRRDETVEFVSLLLEFLHETLDGALRKRLALASLAVTHQTVHDGEAGVRRRGRLVRQHHIADCRVPMSTFRGEDTWLYEVVARLETPTALERGHRLRNNEQMFILSNINRHTHCTIISTIDSASARMYMQEP